MYLLFTVVHEMKKELVTNVFFLHNILIYFIHVLLMLLCGVQVMVLKNDIAHNLHTVIDLYTVNDGIRWCK